MLSSLIAVTYNSERLKASDDKLGFVVMSLLATQQLFADRFNREISNTRVIQKFHGQSASCFGRIFACPDVNFDLHRATFGTFECNTGYLKAIAG